MRMRAITGLAVAIMLSGCTQNAQTKTETPDLGRVEARIRSLENDLQRVKNDVVVLQFDRFVDALVTGVMSPDRDDCKAAVSGWSETERALKSFMEDSAAIRKGRPDATMQVGVKRFLWVLNTNCKSNLVFNP
jgi:hypothetical protein